MSAIRCVHVVKLNMCLVQKTILYNLSKRKRSLCAQIRSGILPLHIESGRWVGTSEENRLCHFCELDEIENEIHFILSVLS